MSPIHKRLLKIFSKITLIIGCIGLCGILMVALFLGVAGMVPHTNSKGEVRFTVSKGQSLYVIAEDLKTANVIENRSIFILLARLLGKGDQIMAGNYLFPSELSSLDVLTKVTQGEFTTSTIQFIEGWNFSQIRNTLNNHNSIKHDTKNLSALDILKRLDIEEQHPEGIFFPDTYHFTAGTSDFVILRNAYNLQQKIMMDLWNERIPHSKIKTPYQALILASIVEKETGKSSERKMIAAVFLNRLQLRMRLQADPTVIYGLADKFDGNLRKRDLLQDQEYNTYTRYGLPPTPIAIPGKAAIESVLRPANTKALYFVSKGDGSHYFSRSLAKHNAAVKKFQKYKRK